jgi:hypothetical protein
VIAVTSEEQSKLVRWEQVSAVAETMTGIPYAVSKASSVQLAQAHDRDLELVPGEARVPVTEVTTQLDVDAVADMRARLKLGRAQRRYFMENSPVQ